MKKLIDNYFKRCFTCKFNKPLVLYKKSKMKYTIPTDKGVNVDCRLCSTKRLIKQNGIVLEYDFNNKKFENKIIKLNIINIIKYYIK